MADDGEDVKGAPETDALGLVAGDDSHVDESSLKLPSQAAVFAGKTSSGEENEDVVIQQ